VTSYEDDAYPGVSSSYAIGQVWQRYEWHGVWHMGNPRRGMIVGFLGTRPIVQYLRDDGTFAEGRTLLWHVDWEKTHD
jgi:hypothetical protein